MNARVERLREGLEEPFLVTDPTNVRYLTGFSSSNAALLVEPERVRMFADFRYAEGARKVEGVEFTVTSRALVRDLADVLDGRIGFEADHLTYARWETIAAGGAELVPRRGVVEALRAVKDDDELDAIRRAAEVTNRAYSRFAQERFVGRTERELAWTMDQLLHDEGADAAAFDTMVLGGAHGARPHATPDDTPIERGQTVVVDAGARLDGYHSDCTRTFATGPLPARLRAAYEACRETQEQALERIRAGENGHEVDAFAHSLVDATEFHGTFGHGLGHGVGLLVHEAPNLRQEEAPTLAAGNVVTVEPGIYLEGEGGIRIEDLVVVRDGDPEVLTSFPKTLVEVD